MYHSKNSFRKNQLNSNSTIFLQLGIILSLIIVYSFFELEFSKKLKKLPDEFIYSEDVPFIISNFKFEKKNVKKETTIMKPLDLSEILILDRPLPEISEVLIPDDETGSEDKVNDIDDIIEVIKEEKDDVIPLNFVEQAPRFPGCKGKNETEFKKCLNKKITTFVSNNFNSSLATGRNNYGKQKIHVQFEIDKNGDIINIEARSVHKSLEKEAIRVVNKLPKMIPGKQQNQNVSVKYYMPILFDIK